MSRLLHGVVVAGLLGLLLLGAAAPVTAQVQQLDKGSIDWNKLVVHARGIGAANPNMPESARRAMAVRAARLDAYRNILEAVKGVTLTAETTVRNFMTENDVIRTKVEGIIQGAQFGDPHYMEDGSVEVDCSVPITGALVEALIYTQPPPGIRPSGPGWNWGGKPAEPVTPPPSSTGTTPATPTPTYTGLIIDARGLGVRPALAPKVLGQGGQELYSAATVSRDYALKMGVAGYAKDLDAAKQDARVTATPLVVKAVNAAGTNKTDVIIQDSDATAVRNASQSGDFLKECRLMILVD